MNPVTPSGYQSVLRWTCKSTTEIASELQNKGHSISSRKVADLLHQLNYSLSNRKTKQGTTRVDRDTQFHYIHDQVQDFLARSEPVISVNIFKKEALETYEDDQQNLHFNNQLKNQLSDVIVYGNHHKVTNITWQRVSIDHDTVEFAVKSIAQWWLKMRQRSYLDATELLLIDGSSKVIIDARWLHGRLNFKSLSTS